MYALGVDLGTVYTAAATWRDGHAEIVSLGSRAATIPSVVLLREDASFLTGEAANRRALIEPSRVAREFKRRFGDATPIMLGGTPHSPEALMGRLLRSVVAEVTAQQGEAPTTLCVCHPANWGPYKTDLLQQAIRMADLNVPVTLAVEPVAAAAYYSRQQRVDTGSLVAVYDLGGGTFDAAVVRKTGDGTFEIVGRPEGIEHLGGADFDAAVFEHVRAVVSEPLAALDDGMPSTVAAVARLREECTSAKETLSSDTDTTIPVLLPNLATEVRITRAELERMVRPSLYDTISALQRAIRSAGVTAPDLHSVLLIGGSSRMPLVSQLVGAELDRPVAVDAHPKHAVALGAALIAGAAAQEETSSPASLVTRVPAAADVAAGSGLAGLSGSSGGNGLAARTGNGSGGGGVPSGLGGGGLKGVGFGAAALGVAAAAAAASAAPATRRAEPDGGAPDDGAGTSPGGAPPVPATAASGISAPPAAGPSAGADPSAGTAAAPTAPQADWSPLGDPPNWPPPQPFAPTAPAAAAGGAAGVAAAPVVMHHPGAPTGSGGPGGPVAGAAGSPPSGPGTHPFAGAPEAPRRPIWARPWFVASAAAAAVVLLATTAVLVVARGGSGSAKAGGTTAPTGTASGVTAPGTASVSPSVSPTKLPDLIYACPTNASAAIWGCLKSAKASGGKLYITYTSNFHLSGVQDAAHYHFHLYLANPGPNGTTDPVDTIMQDVPNPGSWYIIYDGAITTIDNNTLRGGQKAPLDVSNYQLFCVRIASGLHGLINDRNGGYHTGNCVKMTS